VVLAALGERDEEIAASDSRPFDAQQCSAARRQALGVGFKSVASGVVAALLIWILLTGRLGSI
jgi:hypothetical protein